MSGLETPQNPGELYLARGEDALELAQRPFFTGDVVEVAGELVILAQHPCAMRRGVTLVDQLLCYGVQPMQSAPPRDWARGHYRRFFLPELTPDGHFSAEFDDIRVVEADSLDPAHRTAVLSEFGANLLVQRWLYHNARVVVPTRTIAEQTGGQFEEAELLAEGCDALVALGESRESSLTLMDEWLSSSAAPGMPPRREALQAPQERSSVRAGLRRQVRAWRAERA